MSHVTKTYTLQRQGPTHGRSKPLYLQATLYWLDLILWQLNPPSLKMG